MIDVCVCVCWLFGVMCVVCPFGWVILRGDGGLILYIILEWTFSLEEQ